MIKTLEAEDNANISKADRAISDVFDWYLNTFYSKINIYTN